MAFDTNIFEGCDGLFFCLSLWYNTVTFDWFWVLMLLAFGVILFMATITAFGFGRSFGFASVGMSLGALFMVQLGFIPVWFMTLSVVAGIIGIIIMFNQGK